MSEVPTLKEELDRKSLNALAMLQSDKENFRISEETYEYAKKLLWEAFAGIVDQDFMSIMEQMDAEPYLKKNQILYTKKDNPYVLVEIDVVNNNFTLRKGTYEGELTFPNAKEQFKKLHSDLIGKGYTKSVKQSS